MRILAGGPTRGTGSAHEMAWRACIEAQVVPGVLIDFMPIVADGEGYEVTDEAHHWSGVAVARVAQARQAMIDRARAGGYDAVWMVDDDVLCGPGVLAALLGAAGKHDAGVVFGVYWTAGWDADDPTRELPQVWQRHPYGVGEGMIQALREGQIAEVAGGGACTFITGAALEGGAVYWPPLAGLEHWWEDRWACTRWAARGHRMLAVGGLPIHHAYGAPQRAPDAIGAALAALGSFDDQPAPAALPAPARPPLVLALPWYGGPLTDTAASVLKLAAGWGAPVYLVTAERPQVDIARDQITQTIVQSPAGDAAVVLWVDGDMTFDANEIGRMVSLVRPGEVVGAAGRQKIHDVRFCVRELADDPGERRGWVRGKTGGALVAMRLGTMRAMHTGATPYRVGGMDLRAVWPAGVDETGEHIGEDFGMFNLAERLGIACYVDPWVTVGHVGRHNYRGRLADMLWSTDD